MGTDIHLHVETFNDTNGCWEYLPVPTTTPSYRSDWTVYNTYTRSGNKIVNKNDPTEAGFYPSWYCGRNYALFAKLADVRSGALLPNETVMSSPRGLPVGCCKEIIESVHSGSDHSESWALLYELQDEFDEDLHGRPRKDPDGEYQEFREFLKELKQHVGHLTPDRVRVVYWFDS